MNRKQAQKTAKPYLCPTLEVIEAEVSNPLLDISLGIGNDYNGIDTVEGREDMLMLFEGVN